jgi:TatA/E family protein of Tat protein translocase
MGIESPTHLIFIAIVALVVLGPKRLPDLARSLGNGIREFRQSLDIGAQHDPPAQAPLPPAASTPPPDSPAPPPPVAADIPPAPDIPTTLPVVAESEPVTPATHVPAPETQAPPVPPS